MRGNKVNIENGFVNFPIPENINLVDEIKKLKREKNAVILGHYYIKGELQEISDFVGDSLGLSQQASTTKAEMIVFLGVHFMAETAKILNPTKKVIIPDLSAGCSLADSCPTEAFANFVKKNPDHKVITYINATAEIKALSDVICTSSNAKQIVDSFPKDQPLIFAPDKNLGNYINSITGRSMLLWDGACHVHHQFSLQRILEQKKSHPEALLIAHPECQKEILIISDYIGSTSALLSFASASEKNEFIVATESGILHQMRKFNPGKTFYPALPEDASCACNDCNFMKLHTLEKLYNSLKFELPEIVLSKEISDKAIKPILKMLEISK